MKKLTAQMVHEAYCTATPAAWNKPWPQISQAEEARYQVMADYLNGQIAPQEQERHFCAMLDCDQPVAEDGARCSACRACEELQPESAQPPEEPERRHCGRCHTCGARLAKVLDGEEWCDTCRAYRRYPSHGWSRASCSEDALIEQYCPPLPPEDDFARHYEQAKREGDRLFGSGRSS